MSPPDIITEIGSRQHKIESCYTRLTINVSITTIKGAETHNAHQCQLSSSSPQSSTQNPSSNSIALHCNVLTRSHVNYTSLACGDNNMSTYHLTLDVLLVHLHILFNAFNRLTNLPTSDQPVMDPFSSIKVSKAGVLLNLTTNYSYKALAQHAEDYVVT
jgi:hypothetical protein